MTTTRTVEVPFFRPEIGPEEHDGVRRVLDSGWLTTGREVKAFEAGFAEAVRARYAVAVNSATAALHLAARALDAGLGDGVLVPTMTFAATAEVVLQLNALPILVDCDRETLQMDLADAAAKCESAAAGTLLPDVGPVRVAGMMPVYVGGLMPDLAALRSFAAERGLWTVEDAAHAFQSAWRPDADSPWQRCGEGTADVTCFSFYANKVITTGEGGMAVTADAGLSARMRRLSLHGLSHDAWDRYSRDGEWDYKITEAGYKYNMSDLAAAVGVAQLTKADRMRCQREAIALRYLADLAEIEAIELPPLPANRIHAWHLFPIRLRLEKLTIDRARFIRELKSAGISTSVHWRPLHLHPYYQEQFAWHPASCPVAGAEWLRLVSLPIFPGMTEEDHASVVSAIAAVCRRFAR